MTKKRKPKRNQIQTEMKSWSNEIMKKWRNSQKETDTSDNQTDKKYTSKTH